MESTFMSRPLKHAELTDAIIGTFYDVLMSSAMVFWSLFIAKP